VIIRAYSSRDSGPPWRLSRRRGRQRQRGNSRTRSSLSTPTTACRSRWPRRTWTT